MRKIDMFISVATAASIGLCTATIAARVLGNNNTGAIVGTVAGLTALCIFIGLYKSIKSEENSD